MANPNLSLQSKDLITIGIFSTLFFTVTMVAGAFFAPNPLLTYLTPVVVAVFTGPVYLLLLAKVPKRGPTIILGVIMGLLIFITGMFWLWAVAYIVLGVIAGEISAAGRFRSLKLNVLGFCVFSLNPIASYMMIWIDQQAYKAYLVSKGTQPAYMDTMLQAAQEWMLPAMVAGTVLAALAGAAIGNRFLKKHFARAGIL